MRRPTILWGVAVAAAIGCSIWLLQLLAGPFAAQPALAKAAAVLGAAVYLILLYRSSSRQSGRLLLVVLSAAAAAAAAFAMSLPAAVLLLAALIVCSRSLLSYSSVVSAGADAVLTAGALAAATVVFRSSGSTVLAVWCFFLVQALSAAIPVSFTPPAETAPQPAKSDSFAQARRAAEEALEVLAR